MNKTSFQNHSKKSLLSVVIPTLNEEGYIENILEDTTKQNEYSEVIIVDSGSSDNTKSIVKNFIKTHPDKNISLFQAKEKGSGLARNTGIEKSHGTYTVFLDADSRIPKNFFKNILQEMVERKLDIAGCYLKTASQKTSDKVLFFLQKNVLHRPMQYTKHPGCAGAGIVVKKDFHKKIGGFDEKMELSEDLDYCRKGSIHGHFRMLQSTHIIFSMRRFDQEGRMKLWLKYCKSGLYYILNIKNLKIEYTFGQFSKGEKNRQTKEIAKSSITKQ